jgi:hypothetical protein
MKIIASLVWLSAVAWAQSVDRPRVRPIPAAGKNLKTGPEVGASVPAFSLADQAGRNRTLESLSGKNGLLLYFVRSADW